MSDNTKSCPLCLSTDVRFAPNLPEDYEYGVKPGDQFKIVSCNSCGSEFLHPRPSVEEIISFYPSTYHAYNEDHGVVAGALVDARSKARVKQYKNLIPNRDVIRIFDVGSGDCRHFDALKEHGTFEFGGIDISPDMVRAAKDNGYDVEQGTLEEMDIEPHLEKWDIVTMYHLVEHVLEPRVLLQRAFDMLRPGGAVIGQLPCIDSFEYNLFKKHWAGYHYPRHLQMISKKAMREVLTQAGFMDERVTSALHLQTAISIQNVLVSKMNNTDQLMHGKLPYYSFLLLAASPFCIFERVFGQQNS